MTNHVSMSPCPFCSGPPVVITVDACQGGVISDPDPDLGTLAEAHVFCHECGATGPHTDDELVFEGGSNEKLEAEAVRLWNERNARSIALYESSVKRGLNTFPRLADEPGAAPVLPFRHWSKDPLIPYSGCQCSSCTDARQPVVEDITDGTAQRTE